MDKVYAAARAIGVLLAIVAAFITIPNLDVAAVLVVLGMISGIGYSAENAPRLLLTALVLPFVSAALEHIPEVGTYLSAIATNIGLAAAGAAAMVIAIRLFGLVKGDWTTSTAK